MLDVTLLDRGRAVAHVAFRAAFGLMFMQHGAQKLFGAFAGNEAESLASLMGLAGVLEFWGGLLVVVGLGTRWVSLVLAFEMAFAFFYAHVPRGWVPIENGG
ncbi:MAG: DoxX family protein [Gemmatimonadales bacterium]